MEVEQSGGRVAAVNRSGDFTPMSPIHVGRLLPSLPIATRNVVPIAL